MQCAKGTPVCCRNVAKRQRVARLLHRLIKGALCAPLVVRRVCPAGLISVGGNTRNATPAAMQDCMLATVHVHATSATQLMSIVQTLRVRRVTCPHACMHYKHIVAPASKVSRLSRMHLQLTCVVIDAFSAASTTMHPGFQKASIRCVRTWRSPEHS